MRQRKFRGLRPLVFEVPFWKCDFNVTPGVARSQTFTAFLQHWFKSHTSGFDSQMTALWKDNQDDLRCAGGIKKCRRDRRSCTACLSQVTGEICKNWPPVEQGGRISPMLLTVAAVGYLAQSDMQLVVLLVDPAWTGSSEHLGSVGVCTASRGALEIFRSGAMVPRGERWRRRSTGMVTRSEARQVCNKTRFSSLPVNMSRPGPNTSFKTGGGIQCRSDSQPLRPGLWLRASKDKVTVKVGEVQEGGRVSAKAQPPTSRSLSYAIGQSPLEVKSGITRQGGPGLVG